MRKPISVVLTLSLLHGLWFISIPFSSAQNSYLDSLQQVLDEKQRAKDIKATCATLLSIGNQYFNEQKDSFALVYFERGLKVVPDSLPILKGTMLYKKANVLYYLGGDKNEIKTLSERAIGFLENHTDKDLLFAFYRFYGGFLVGNAFPEAGREALHQAEQIYLKNELTVPISIVLNLYANLIAVSSQVGDIEAVLEYSRNGNEIVSECENDETIGDFYYNIAYGLNSFGFVEERIQHYKKSQEHYLKAGKKAGAAYAQIAIAYCYREIDDFLLSDSYLQKAKKYYLSVNDSLSLAHINGEIANNLHETNNTEKAVVINQSIINYFEKNPDSYHSRGMYHRQALFYEELGLWDSVVLYCQKDIELSHSDIPLLVNTYKMFSNAEKERGNYQESLMHLEQYDALKDSIYSENLEAKLAEENTKQKVEDIVEERENAELKALLLNSQKNLYLGLAVALLSFLLIVGVLFLQLRKARKSLEIQNNKLLQLNATKDKFFGIIAHDIRSPIIALDGVGQQLNYFLKKQKFDKLEQLTSGIDKTAKRLSSLLDNLLNWALLQQGVIPYQPMIINLHREAEQTFKMFAPSATHKGVSLVNEIDADLQVYADERALSTILRNLISNAIKYSMDGDSVKLIAQKEDDKVILQISDTGTGIHADRLPHIFNLNNKSRKGTSGEKGTGLGLTLVKELVELNKGEIQVESLLDEGTTFSISLPLPTKA